MVLAELADGVAMRLEQLGHGRVFSAQTDVGPRHSDLGQTCTDRILASDERGASSGAGLLPVGIGKQRALVCDAVDVWGPVAHLAAAIVADVPPADVVALEDEDVRLVWFSHFNLLFS